MFGAHLKAGHIAGDTRRARITTAGRRLAVAARCVINDDLQILVGVIYLLGLEFQRHVERNTQKREIVLRIVVIEGGTVNRIRVARLFIATVVDGKLAGPDGARLLVEHVVGHIGARGNCAVTGGQAEAAQVQDLEAVRAGGAVLIPIGISAGGVLRDGDFHGVHAGLKGHLVGHAREVLPCEGGEGDGAVLNGLGDGEVSATGDFELAVDVFDGPCIGRPRAQS